MKKSDIRRLKCEVLDRGPEAALPCNLPDEWLRLLARDLEMVLQGQYERSNYLNAPLAIVIQLLQAKSCNSETEVSFSEEELLHYLQYLEIEIALEMVRRAANIVARPATIETIFTDRDT